MSLPNPYSQYRQTQVQTASPLRLVVMLYDGAIRFLSQAVVSMRAKDYYNQAQYINKAQAIIAHLAGTLDLKHGGDVAANLARIYDYMFTGLSQANAHDDASKIEEIIAHLKELRSSWSHVALKSSKTPSEQSELPKHSDLLLAA